MFPEQFWLEVTLMAAFATVAQAFSVVGGSWLVLRRLQASDKAEGGTLQVKYDA
jgi:hypothetical protein